MSSPSPHHIVGVDVGGTYTDIFVLDEASGAVRIAKVPSTNAQAGSDQSVGFLRGVAQGLGEVSFDHIATVMHVAERGIAAPHAR